MATDSKTKLQGRISDILEDGETVLGFQPLTTRGPRAVTDWMAETNVTEALPALHQAKGVECGLVLSDRRLPTGFLLVVTEERLMIFARSVSGKPKELLELWDRDDVILDVIDQGTRVKSRLFFLGLPDGTCTVGEAPINGQALASSDEFVATFTRNVLAGASS